MELNIILMRRILALLVLITVNIGLSTEEEEPSSSCDLQIAEGCHSELVTYETFHFPYYGGDEETLDATCNGISTNFQCIKDLTDNCKDESICDEACQHEVSSLAFFLKMSGLVTLSQKLCTPGESLREKYLENYPCLLSVSEKFNACYNMSEQSKEFMAGYSFESSEEQNKAGCCFFSWYQTCYTNATMEDCGVNSAFVMSQSVNLMLGSYLSSCGHMPYCYKPPSSENPFGVDSSIKKPFISPSGASAFTISSFLVFGMWMHFLAACKLVTKTFGGN